MNSYERATPDRSSLGEPTRSSPAVAGSRASMQLGLLVTLDERLHEASADVARHGIDICFGDGSRHGDRAAHLAKVFATVGAVGEVVLDEGLESDPTMSHELLTRGYTLAESTRAMGRSLDDLADTHPAFDLSSSDLLEHVEIIGLPGLLRGVDPAAFHVVVARLGIERVATAMAFDHAGDCGVYNVGTLEPARRRGIATAVTHRLLQDAAARGCTTASLQATEMAEGVYAAAGFLDLGRILEYVPAPRLHEGAVS